MDNMLIYGDNLTIMKNELKAESVNLIYLDPPFKSNKNYNQIFKNEEGKNSTAQIMVFDDTWNWDNNSEKTYLETVMYSKNDLVSKYLISMREFLGTNSMMAYLVMMAPRLLEMHKILKPNGVLFLHCDPSASHYLKLLLDAVFGFKNFINELIWCYRQGGRGKRSFAKKHDVIYFYAKNENYFFNPDSIRVKYHGTGGYVKNNNGNTVNGKRYRPNPKGKIPEDWWDIPALTPTSSERVGYPTQKPLALLERIILSTTNEGDVILDPFCGCGTAIIAAEKLNRKWIGIDVTHIAITTIKKRLQSEFGMLPIYIPKGEPIDIEGARELALSNRFQFQIWALSLLGVEYKNGIKKGPDGGIDGLKYFEDKNMGTLKKCLIQVKSGKVQVKDIREFNTVLNNENAPIGIFLTLLPPTKPMIQEAAKAGVYEGKKEIKYPKIKIVEITDLLEHRIMPYNLLPD